MTTTTQQESLNKDSLVEKAKKLQEGIAARREQTEKDRRVAYETVEEMQDAGLFQMLQSKNYGGLERPADEFFDVVAKISAACPSTGWVLGIVGVHPFDFSMMEPEFQEELYHDDPKTLVSSSYGPQGTAVKAPGGYRLTGRWRSSSGVDHATWVVLGANDPSTDGQEVRRGRTYVVPISDYKLLDDWFVMGLAGTGSKSVVLDDVYVPEHRTIERRTEVYEWPGQRVNKGALFRIPRGTIYTGAGSAPAVGAAKGMYKEFVRQVGIYTPRRDTQPRGTAPWVQRRLADAQSLINNAEQRMMRAYREMMELAEAEIEIDVDKQIRFTWDIAQAADDCVTAARYMFETFGAGAIYSTSPLQAYYRDLITMRQHGTQSRDIRAMAYAQNELGLPVTGMI